MTIDPDTGHLWTATGNGFVFDPVQVSASSRRPATRGCARAGRRSQRHRVEPAGGRRGSRRGQRLRRRAAALPARRLPAARSRQREERQDVHLEPRGSRRRAALEHPRRPRRARRVPRPARATRQNWACSSSPPRGDEQGAIRTSTPSSASRSGPAARSRNGRHGRRPASAAAPSHRRSSSATSCSSPAASTGTPLPSTPRPARCCGR